MLDWLKEKDLSSKLVSALNKCIESSYFTPDLGGTHSTSEVTDKVIEFIKDTF